jgi:hypothetical protein
MAILDGVAAGQNWPRSGYLFSTTGKTPVSGFSKAKRRLDEFMTKELEHRFVQWRAHDIRRTLATGLQRLGVRFEVTEAVLNHVSGAKSGVPGVYQRYNWEHERRAALCAWADHLNNIIDKDTKLPNTDLVTAQADLEQEVK